MSFFIISDSAENIKVAIQEELERGVTVFHGEGGYKGEPKKILMCAVNRRQTAALRAIVKRIDPDAFVLLNDVSDVMGYRFKSRHIEM